MTGTLRIARLVEERELDRALRLASSKDRAHLLVEWFATRELSDHQIRELLVGHWSTTEAWQGDEPLRAGMMAMLARVAPIAVGGVMPRGRLTVYRGNCGESPGAGSWTLNYETARYFAMQPFSCRGEHLAMRPTGRAAATVWKAKIDAKDVLGYFQDRDEQEVVIGSPHVLRSVHEIASGHIGVEVPA